MQVKPGMGTFGGGYPPNIVLYGREREQAALERLLDEAGAGRGAALLLWGEPGIGKSSLAEYAAARATAMTPAFTVLRCRGSVTESALAFAGLHELLWPVLGRVDALPGPQAAALRGALGLTQDPADRFLIGAAVLTLLSELAGQRPVLVIADDARWLDDGTAQCLSFVARRLGTEPVAMVLTGRPSPVGGRFDGVPHRQLGPLPESDARRLVAATAPGLRGDQARQVVRAACGNPLALLELPADADPAALNTADGVLAVGPRLREAFAAKIADLPAGVRALLLVMAAEDRGDPSTVWAAATSLGVTSADYDQAARAGLVHLADGHAEPRHPLVHLAVYHDASPARRQEVHRALAAALSGEGDRDRRLWHLAAAATEPDEDLARQMEEAADRAWSRSGCLAASRALTRAAALSPASHQGGVRLARAAKAAWEGGEAATARRLLESAGQLIPAEALTDAGQGLAGVIEYVTGDADLAQRTLLEEASRACDPLLTTELTFLAVRAAWTAATPHFPTRAAQLLRELPDIEDPPAAALVATLARWCQGEPGAADAACRALQATVDRGFPLSRWLLPPAPVALAWGVEHPIGDIYRQLATGFRAQGAATRVAAVQAQLADLAIATGRWADATADAIGAVEIAEEIGAHNTAAQCHGSLAWLAALRGDRPQVQHLTAASLAAARPRGKRALIAAAHWHRGLSALGAGAAEEACDHLHKLTMPGHEAHHPDIALLAAPDTIEAAVRAGRHTQAHDHLTRLTQWTPYGGAWAASAGQRCAALLTGGPAAEPLFAQALAVPGAADRPFDFARTQLLYGQWLRRAGRRTDARPLLTAAHTTFARLGAHPWTEQARTAAQLAGQPPTRPRNEQHNPLTPQELRVAQLAAQGLTNREIGAHLFISPRTAGHHLSSTYAKLGLTTRTDLRNIDLEGTMRLTP